MTEMAIPELFKRLHLWLIWPALKITSAVTLVFSPFFYKTYNDSPWNDNKLLRFSTLFFTYWELVRKNTIFEDLPKYYTVSCHDLKEEIN